MTQLLAVIVIFCAVFTQSATGFGSALVAMGILPGLLGMQVAAPLVALLGGTLEIVLLVRYRSALNPSAIWRLALASLIGVPLGIYGLGEVDDRIAMSALGAVIAGYGLYGLFNWRLPRFTHPIWAYSLGFLAGLLGGAFNTGGPPVVIYGHGRAWQPAEFKSNLQSFFLLNSTLVIIGHAISRHLTPPVWSGYLVALPALVAGVLVGTRLDSRMNPVIFRKIVLVLLILMGARMLFFG